MEENETARDGRNGPVKKGLPSLTLMAIGGVGAGGGFIFGQLFGNPSWAVPGFLLGLLIGYAAFRERGTP